MTGYEIKYIRTGSGETKKYDRVFIWENDEMEFEDGIEIAHNITEIIELFEKIAAKYWGTYETRHAIVNIERIEV
jgi:hypothetical protein